MDVRHELTELEAPFARNFYNGDILDSSAFVDAPGSVLLAAPHATNYVLDGKRRFADRGTGSLVQLLGRTAGQPSLVTTGMSTGWLYWDERSDTFKASIDRALEDGRYIVDVQGVGPRYGGDLFIGYGSDPTEEDLELAGAIGDAFSDFTVLVGGPRFNATSPRSILSYVRMIGGRGIQLDLAPSLRDTDEHPDTTAEFVTRFRDVLLAREQDSGLSAAA